MTTTTTALKVLGITDERAECECCGRTDLKRTVAIGTGEGDVAYYGTECASKILGWDAKRVQREVKSVERIAAEDRNRESIRRQNERQAAYAEWLMATYGDTSSNLERFRAYKAATAD